METSIEPIGVTPDKIVSAIREMSASNPTLDDLGIARNIINVLLKFAREADAAWDAIALAKVKAEGEFQLGTKKYFAAVDKKTECIDEMKVIETLLAVGGGELELIRDCLSANCYKHGAIKKYLTAQGKAELYAGLFRVVEKDRLGEKQLQVIDERFLK